MITDNRKRMYRMSDTQINDGLWSGIKKFFSGKSRDDNDPEYSVGDKIKFERRNGQNASGVIENVYRNEEDGGVDYGVRSTRSTDNIVVPEESIINDSKDMITKNRMYRVTDTEEPQLLDKGKLVLVLYKNNYKQRVLGYSNGIKQAKAVADKLFKENYDYKADEYDIRVFNTKKYEDYEQHRRWGDKPEKIPTEYIVANYNTDYQDVLYDDQYTYEDEDGNEIELAEGQDNYDKMCELCDVINKTVDDLDYDGGLPLKDALNIIDNAITYDYGKEDTYKQSGHIPIDYYIVFETDSDYKIIGDYCLVLKVKDERRYGNVILCKVGKSAEHKSKVYDE